MKIDYCYNGFATFGSVFVDGDSFFYAITDGSDYEIGSGIFVAGSPNNSIQRNCPIVINRLDACIEYLGSDYPLYYDYPDEIQDLLSESSVASAHEYLKQLDINSFSMDSFVAKINHFVKQVSSHA